jgi:hypothetical protein
MFKESTDLHALSHIVEIRSTGLMRKATAITSEAAQTY